MGWSSKKGRNLDIPHAGSDLDHSIVVLWATQRQKWSSLGGQNGGARVGSVLDRAATTLLLTLVGQSLIEFLTATRTVRGWSRLVSTSTVGGQMSIVDGGDCEC